MTKPKEKAKKTQKGILPDETIRVVAAPILRLKFDLNRRITILDSSIGGQRQGKYILPAIDLDTNARVEAALPADVVAILEKAYPARSYIGRSFSIIKHRYVSESYAYSKRAGYSIDEIRATEKNKR